MGHKKTTVKKPRLPLNAKKKKVKDRQSRGGATSLYNLYNELKQLIVS